MMEEEELEQQLQQDQGRARAGAAGEEGQVLDDFPGDAEQAWERLGCAAAALVPATPALAARARGQAWLCDILAATASVGGAAALEVAAQGGGAAAAIPAGRGAVLRRLDLVTLVQQAVGLRLLLVSMEQA